MLPFHTCTRDCQECHKEYQGTRFDDSRCVDCRRMVALERIAEVLEHWVGML